MFIITPRLNSSVINTMFQMAIKIKYENTSLDAQIKMLIILCLFHTYSS